MSGWNDALHRLRRGHTGAYAGAILLAIAVLNAAASRAAADNNSLVGYPSTAIYARNEVHFDLDTLGKGLKFDTVILAGATYGFGPDRDGLFGRTEFGFDYLLSVGGQTPRLFYPKRLVWNIKTQLYNDDESGVRVVAGFYGVGAQEAGAPNIGYLLASGTFKWGRVHLGYAHAYVKEALLRTPAGKADRDYIQVAFQRRLVGRLFGAFNFYSGKSTQSRFAPGVTYFLDGNYRTAIALGLLRYNDSSVRPARNQIYLGYDQTLPGR